MYLHLPQNLLAVLVSLKSPDKGHTKWRLVSLCIILLFSHFSCLWDMLLRVYGIIRPDLAETIRNNQRCTKLFTEPNGETTPSGIETT